MFGLNINLEEVKNSVILHLEGRIDAANSPSLEKRMQKLKTDKYAKILLDLQGVDYLSSAGLRVFLSFTKQLKAEKKKLVLFSVNEEVLEIIKVAGFTTIIKIVKNRDDALKL